VNGVDDELQVYVGEGCGSCQRTVAVLRECEELRAVVRVAIYDVAERPLPAGCPGIPAIVFRGRVLAMGTPDCGRLLADVCRILAREEVDSK